MEHQNFFNLTGEEIRKIVRNNAKIYEGMLLNYDEPLFPPKHVLDKSNLDLIPENSMTIHNCTKTKLSELL